MCGGSAALLHCSLVCHGHSSVAGSVSWGSLSATCDSHMQNGAEMGPTWLDGRSSGISVREELPRCSEHSFAHFQQARRPSPLCPLSTSSKHHDRAPPRPPIYLLSRLDDSQSVTIKGTSVTVSRSPSANMATHLIDDDKEEHSIAVREVHHDSMP
jgi:hypothetical protein